MRILPAEDDSYPWIVADVITANPDGLFADGEVIPPGRYQIATPDGSTVIHVDAS